MEDRPGDGDALLLAARQSVALVPEDRVVSVGLREDEVVGVGRAGRRHDVLETRGGLPVGDVLPDRAVEEDRFLQDDADVAPQVLEPDVPQVHAVQGDRTVIHIVEPADEIDGRALPGARLADQPDHLAGPDMEIDVPEHRQRGVIAERHVFEDDLAPGARHRPRVPVLVILRLHVDELEDPFGGAHRPGHPAVDPAEPAQRSVEHVQIEVEHDQFARGELLPEHLPAAHQPDHDEAQEVQQAHGGEVVDPLLLGPVFQGEHVPRVTPEPADFPVLLGEGLDDADPRKGLLDVGEEPFPLAPHAGVVDPQPLVQDAAPYDDERHGDQDVQREHPVGIEQHADDPERRQPAEDEEGQAVHQEAAHVPGVPRYPRKQAARLLLVVESKRQVFHVVVHLGPDIGHHAGAHPGRQPAVRHLAQPADDEQDAHDRDQPEQEFPVPVLEGVVDDELRDLGREELRHAEHGEQRHHGDGLAPVGPQVGADPLEHAPLADAGRTQPVLRGQAPAAGLADHPRELRLDLERLFLDVLLDAPLRLVEEVDPALGILDERDGVLGRGDFQAGPADQGFHGHPGQVRKRDGDVVARAVQFQGHDPAVGHDEPRRLEPAPRVHVRFQRDVDFFVGLQYGVDFLLNLIRQGIGQAHGASFGTMLRGVPSCGMNGTSHISIKWMHP